MLYTIVNTEFHSICPGKGNKFNHVFIAVGALTTCLINSCYTFLLVIFVISVILWLNIILNLGSAVYQYINFHCFEMASSSEYTFTILIFYSGLTLSSSAVIHFSLYLKGLQVLNDVNCFVFLSDKMINVFHKDYFVFIFHHFEL